MGEQTVKLPPPRQSLKTNADHYNQLLDDLAADWNTDWEMYTTNLALWELAHQLETWLWEQKENPTVPAEQYQEQCDRLRRIYGQQRAKLDLSGIGKG